MNISKEPPQTPPTPGPAPGAGEEPPLIQIRFRPDLAQFDFTNEDGAPVFITTTSPFASREAGGFLVEDLLDIQFAAETPRDYPLPALAQKTGDAPEELLERILPLLAVMPSRVITVLPPERRSPVTRVCVGRFALSVATGPSSEAQRQDYPARRAEAAAKIQGDENWPTWLAAQATNERLTSEIANRPRLEAIDEHKTSRLRYDHATFRIGGEFRYLQIAATAEGVSPGHLLTARVLEAFADDRVATIGGVQGGKLRQHNHRQLCELIWNDMPLAERRLFLRSEGRPSSIYGDSLPIVRQMVRVLSMLSELTIRGVPFVKLHDDKSFFTAPMRVKAEFHAAPPEDAYVFPALNFREPRRRAAPAQPPVPADQNSQQRPEVEVSPEEQALAAKWFELNGTPGSLPDAREAYALLKLHNSRSGLQALRQAAGSMSPAGYEKFTAYVRGRIIQVLGRGTYNAALEGKNRPRKAP